jgi:hypothetical protein
LDMTDSMDFTYELFQHVAQDFPFVKYLCIIMRVQWRTNHLDQCYLHSHISHILIWMEHTMIILYYFFWKNTLIYRVYHI